MRADPYKANLFKGQLDGINAVICGGRIFRHAKKQQFHYIVWADCKDNTLLFVGTWNSQSTSLML